MNNFLKIPLDKWVFVWYIIVVREGISKALLLTDATSANGEEHKNARDVCISVARPDNAGEHLKNEGHILDLCLHRMALTT